MTVDPWLMPASVPERLKVADMRQDINARLTYSQYDDPTLYPQLVAKTLHELGVAAEGQPQDGIAIFARTLLELLHHRAVSGVSYNEAPAEPDWSLDPEERHIPGSERR